MKLSISNIAWTADQDEAVYRLMRRHGFTGLEIAPTRIFPDNPYDKLEEAHTWAKQLKREHVLEISSMQSIWFGRQENMFASEKERRVLLDYTKKAIDFAVAVGCKNLVFGCPRNRVISDASDAGAGKRFFQEIGNYAYAKGTVIGMEANPTIYHTNYINSTADALELIEKVHSKGFLLNLDLGTMIQNGESIDVLYGKIRYINHVHISEPFLSAIRERKIHVQLREALRTERYCGFISVEMSGAEDLKSLENCMVYVRRVMNE